MRNNTSRFRIYGIVPSMSLPSAVKVGPVVFCTTQQLIEYDLRGDQQIDGIKVMVDRYRTNQGEVIGQFGLILLPASTAKELTAMGVPKMAREALSFAHVTAGTQRKSINSSVPVVYSSDYFDILPLSTNGDKYRIDCPGLMSINHEVSRFCLTRPVHLPTMLQTGFTLDEFLLDACRKALKMFISGRSRPKIRQIFRALNRCYHATQLLAETEADYNDLGTRVIDWVSAFETLIHPGKGSVGFEHVTRLINKVFRQKMGRFRKGKIVEVYPEIAQARFVHKWRTGSGDVKTKRENVACLLYRHLYRLRNDLAHGNAFKPSDFSIRPSSCRVDLPVPLLFRECLIERFREIGVLPIVPHGRLSEKQFIALVRENLINHPYQEALRYLLLERNESEA